jgi:lipoprotein-anchoring transpeptidase ErfK/SrfK
MKNVFRRHPRIPEAIPALLVAAGSALVSACAQLPSADPPATAAPPEPPAQELLYEWNGDGRTISRIKVDVDEQKAIFYDGSEQIGWGMVATGIRHFSTPKGRFTITEKVADKRSNLYGRIYDSSGKLAAVNARRGVHRIPPGGRFQGANMPYFMRLTRGGVGMHGGPIPDPGTPASHGCIRLPKDLAPIVYEHVRVGTPVRIVGIGPS